MIETFLNDGMCLSSVTALILLESHFCLALIVGGHGVFSLGVELPFAAIDSFLDKVCSCSGGDPCTGTFKGLPVL